MTSHPLTPHAPAQRPTGNTLAHSGSSHALERFNAAPITRIWRFVAIGVGIAAIGETQFSVFIRGDVGNLIGSVVFNSTYLSLCSLVSALLVKRLGDTVAAITWHVALFGSTGLMIEWFLIGNSPWAAPQASQIGMFFYWSSMVVVAFVCLRPQVAFARLKKAILMAVFLYTVAALSIQLIPSQPVHFACHIWSVILGYTALTLFSAFGYARALRRLTPTVAHHADSIAPHDHTDV